jgi:hypothetical protein
MSCIKLLEKRTLPIANMIYTAQFLVVVKNSSVVEAKPSSNALRRSTGLPNSVSFLITPFVSSASFVLEEGRPSTH